MNNENCHSNIFHFSPLLYQRSSNRGNREKYFEVLYDFLEKTG